MLRRPPTLITLTPEDIAAYEDNRQARLEAQIQDAIEAQKKARAAAQLANARPYPHNGAPGGAETPQFPSTLTPTRPGADSHAPPMPADKRPRFTHSQAHPSQASSSYVSSARSAAGARLPHPPHSTWDQPPSYPVPSTGGMNAMHAPQQQRQVHPEHHFSAFDDAENEDEDEEGEEMDEDGEADAMQEGSVGMALDGQGDEPNYAELVRAHMRSTRAGRSQRQRDRDREAERRARIGLDM